METYIAVTIEKQRIFDIQRMKNVEGRYFEG